MVLRDGVGVGLAAWLQGQPFPANLNGTDFGSWRGSSITCTNTNR
jgi:UDP-N-acetyl-D-mannosaminuronic acid transferase (WecB/TagA/CpsF family)